MPGANVYQGANEYAPLPACPSAGALEAGKLQGPSQATNLRDSSGSQMSPFQLQACLPPLGPTGRDKRPPCILRLDSTAALERWV